MQLRLVGSGLVFLSYYLAALCFNSQSSPNDGNLTDWIVIKLVRVPAGSFLMGEPSPSQDSWDEQPVDKITITRSFLISETEISTEQFQKFRPGFQGSLAEKAAVTRISWHDAAAGRVRSKTESRSIASKGRSMLPLSARFLRT
jgi:hypothetical protein